MGTKRKIVLMYHGERADTWRGKIWQCFRSKDGKEHSFSGIKNIYFGECYAMLDSKMKIRPEAVPGWEPTEKERTEYEAQKLVVRQVRQSRLEAFKLTRPHKDVLRAVELLRPFYRALTDSDRNRFMKWVSNECSKKK